MTSRIGLTTTRIEPFNAVHGLDGIGTYTTQLLKNLPRYGCEVHSCFYAPFRYSGQAGDIGQPFDRPYGVQVLLSEFAGLSLSLRGKVDLLHVTDYHIARADVPVVASLHDAIPLLYPEWTTPRLRGAKNWLMRRSARHADQIIALSEAAVDDVVAGFRVSRDRITVVPCGVDDRWLQRPAREDVTQALGARSLTAGYFLFVGTLQPRKNVSRIVQAYRSLPAALRSERSLVIVGRPGWRCESDIIEIESARSAGFDVIWLNDVRDSAELLKLYAGAGQFIFPSLYEGFGIPVLEAFACGIPVVTSHLSSLPEVAADAATFVDPNSIRSIADGMIRVIEDPVATAELVTRGEKRARAYTWSKTAELTAAVYRKLI